MDGDTAIHHSTFQAQRCCKLCLPVRRRHVLRLMGMNWPPFDIWRDGNAPKRKLQPTSIVPVLPPLVSGHSSHDFADRAILMTMRMPYGGRVPGWPGVRWVRPDWKWNCSPRGSSGRLSRKQCGRPMAIRPSELLPGRFSLTGWDERPREIAGAVRGCCADMGSTRTSLKKCSAVSESL
jgi:hypothetical protein